MTDTPAPSKQPGKNAFLFVIVAVVLNMISFGIIIPVMPDLLEELTGRPAAEAVWDGVLLSATFAVANFIAMPILGGLSDAYGRRPVMLASIAMLGIDLLIMGLAPTLAILFVGRFLGGLFSATYSVANAYIADVTEPEQRGQAFGMMGAAFGIGFILGPVFGGILGDRPPPFQPGQSQPLWGVQAFCQTAKGCLVPCGDCAVSNRPCRLPGHLELSWRDPIWLVGG